MQRIWFYQDAAAFVQGVERGADIGQVDGASICDCDICVGHFAHAMNNVKRGIASENLSIDRDGWR